MTVEKKRLAILRLRHDPTVMTISDEACRAVLTTGYPSVLGYWENSTYGYLDLSDYVMSEWLDVTLTAADLFISDPVNNPGTAKVLRTRQGELAIDAFRASHPGADPLAGIDGVVVVTLPGTAFVMANPQAGMPGQPANLNVFFDGGTDHARDFTVAAIPIQPSTMSFAAHEVGHVLGLRHSFGILNQGSNWNAETTADDWLPNYGSPYDIMSAEQYGGGDPTFDESFSAAAGANPGWPGGRWVTMGPSLSAAGLHNTWPRALDGRKVVRELPSGSGTGTVTLVPARHYSGTVALILRPPGSADAPDPTGDIVVEYRTPVGWDAGLPTTGTDLARSGVVVHEILDTGTDQGRQPWYRGNIVDDGLRDNLVVEGHELVITAFFTAAADGTPDHVTVKYETSRPPAVSIVSTERIDEIVGGTATRTSRTPCGDKVEYGRWELRSVETFGARVTGLASTPARTDDTSPIDVEWRVGTESVPDGTGSVSVIVGGVSVDVRTFVDSAARTLTVTAPDGVAVSTMIGVRATDKVGRTAAGWPVAFTCAGYYTGIKPSHIASMAQCIARLVPRILLDPKHFELPPDPRYIQDLWRVLAGPTIETLTVSAELDRDARKALGAIEQVIDMVGQTE